MLFLAKSWACSAEIRRFNTFADVVRNTGEPVRLTLSIQRKPLFAMDFEGTYVTVAALSAPRDYDAIKTNIDKLSCASARSTGSRRNALASDGHNLSDIFSTCR